MITALAAPPSFNDMALAVRWLLVACQDTGWKEISKRTHTRAWSRTRVGDSDVRNGGLPLTG
jgi:hypothetical protein